VTDTSIALSEEEPVAPDLIDGRSLRRLKNRDAVIDALISLLTEGNLSPTVAEVANKAEISPRSVFRYFADVDAMMEAAIDSRMRTAYALARLPVPRPKDLVARLEKLADTREALYSYLAPVARVVRNRLRETVPTNALLEESQTQLREQINEVFRDELYALGERAAEALIVLDTLFSYDGWNHLRVVSGLSADEVRRIQISAGQRILGAS
jgi:AcrR family transcriptional regulator